MRLIDADALIEHLRKDPLFGLVDKYGIINVIASRPTVDATPKTQCRDCQFSGKYSGIDLRKITYTG